MAGRWITHPDRGLTNGHVATMTGLIDVSSHLLLDLADGTARQDLGNTEDWAPQEVRLRARPPARSAADQGGHRWRGPRAMESPTAGIPA